MNVTSVDGTTISFLSVGEGPGLVVLPGNNRRAHHYARLADALSTSYTVPQLCEDVAELIPGARYERIAGLGHNAPDNEAPTEIAARITTAMAAS